MGKKEVAIVIMEQGAQFPAGVAELQARVSRAVVDAQQPDESPKSFASRIVRRLQRLANEGEVPASVVLSTTATQCPKCTAARYEIARAALAAMIAAGYGQLVLFSDQDVSDEVRHELFAFAGALCEGLGGADIAVNVRFSSHATKSGPRSVRPERLSQSAVELA